MKKIVVLFLSSFFLISCKQAKKEGDFNVLPLPQEFDITGISDLTFKDVNTWYAENDLQLPVTGKAYQPLTKAANSSESAIVFTIDDALDIKPEGYNIQITQKQITITGKDQAGLFYGFKTLGQLLEDAKEQNANLPLCRITDYPELAYRAIHLDVKHHLEKTEYYYKLIDKLSSYKINAIIAEVEDKLAYERQPKVASADALPISEWKKISDYAHERHIEISPLIQGLGHASFILKHKEYEDLRDNPNSDWAFNPLDERTYKVQFDLYLDALEATPHGKYLHVGGDEVHTTGRESGKSALELQLYWLNRVSKWAEEHGRIPIFWDDMPLKQADVYEPMFRPEMTQEEVDKVWEENEHKLVAFLDKFPKNCIYMRWNYSSPEALGNSKAMDWFRKHNLQVMGATAGQTRWVLMPQEESNMDNIRSFALNSIESDSKGLLLTLWDDDSPHFELYTRGIIAFAEYTWTGDKRSKDDIKSAYRQREFSYELAKKEYAFIDELEEPVAFWKNALLKGNKRNYLKSSENPFESVIDLPNENKKGEWSEKYSEKLSEAAIIIKKTDSIQRKITEAKNKAIRNGYSLEIYEQVNKMVTFSPKVLLLLGKYDTTENLIERKEIAKELMKLQEQFKDIRESFENVYSKTRILNKPDDYILDQDHHVHLANQGLNFNWQFYAESLFLEKLSKHMENAIYIETADPLVN